MRRTFSAAALAVVLVLLVAACGSSDDGSDTSATATWADEVCSSVTTWTDSLTASVSSLQGGNISRESLEGAADDVKSSTETLVDDLKGARQARHRGRPAGEGLRRPAGGAARPGSREDRGRRRRRLRRQRRAHGDLDGELHAREHGNAALVDLQRARDSSTQPASSRTRSASPTPARASPTTNRSHGFRDHGEAWAVLARTSDLGISSGVRGRTNRDQTNITPCQSVDVAEEPRPRSLTGLPRCSPVRLESSPRSAPRRCSPRAPGEQLRRRAYRRSGGPGRGPLGVSGFQRAHGVTDAHTSGCGDGAVDAERQRLSLTLVPVERQGSEGVKVGDATVGVL